ncbi:MAG: hypothetical protein QOE92_1930 [Chloroflexota bacterium]|jgi:uncharacterized membrane protein|nr:hypothetical protein [Chloroflexota bacterium]
MAEVEKSIEVDVPVSTAYNQWTQFEDFPQFMEGVKEVRQLDDTKLIWRADVAGKEKEWEAAITKQEPDQRIAWRSVNGAENAGDVRFEAAGDNRTLVKLHMHYDPEGPVETIGDVVGVLDRTVEKDLERFKEFIEKRGQETGAWRGEVEEPHPEGASNPEK